jgi:ATP-dependent Clp protease ATP-binding subunit ClpC
VLDDGHLTDGNGRKVDFKNTVIIMTSNVGVREVKQTNRIGFSENVEE